MSAPSILYLKGIQVSGTNTITIASDVATNLSAVAPTLDSHVANKSYVDTGIANLVNNAPALLDTLNELAAALNDDANFGTTVTALITANSTAIVVENSRALAAEAGLSSDLSLAISTENSRALGIEGGLRSDLSVAIATEASNALAAAGLSSDLSLAISTENSRALGIEGGLRTDLSVAIADLAALRSDHDTLSNGSSSNTANLVLHVQAIWDAFYSGAALPSRYLPA